MEQKKGEKIIMKKFTRISLMVAAVLAIIGVVLVLIAGIMGIRFGTIREMAEEEEINLGRWHIGSDGIYYGENYEVYEETREADDYKEIAAASVKNISMDVDAAEILFTKSDQNDTIEVTLLSNDRVKKYNCSNDNDTLKITCTAKKGTLENTTVPRLTVALPEEISLEEMDISVGTSDVEITDEVISCENLTLKVGAGELSGQGFYVSDKAVIQLGAGELSLTGGKCRELSLKCGVGELNFNGEVTGDISADCGVGEITMELNGQEKDYNYDINCGMGDFKLNGVSYSEISGGRKITRDGAEKEIKADCGTGEIVINFFGDTE